MGREYIISCRPKSIHNLPTIITAQTAPPPFPERPPPVQPVFSHRPSHFTTWKTLRASSSVSLALEGDELLLIRVWYFLRRWTKHTQHIQYLEYTHPHIYIRLCRCPLQNPSSPASAPRPTRSSPRTTMRRSSSRSAASTTTAR